MIIIQMNNVHPLVNESCYQDAIQSLYNWHFQGPMPGIPGVKTELNDKAFDWAIAFVGAKSKDEKKIVNKFFEKDATIYWKRVNNLIKIGSEFLKEFSNIEHLALIRYFNPKLTPCLNTTHSPALLEYSLRKYGPLFAAGVFLYKNLHVITLVGVGLNDAKKYCVYYQDGVIEGIQSMLFEDYVKNLTKDQSAVLYYNIGYNEFTARGERVPGTIFKFQFRRKFEKNYLFKTQNEDITELCEYKGQISVDNRNCFEGLTQEDNCIYTAVPNPYSLNDLNSLSLIFCRNPQEALQLLEVDCKNSQKNNKKLPTLFVKRKFDGSADEDEPERKRPRFDQ